MTLTRGQGYPSGPWSVSSLLSSVHGQPVFPSWRLGQLAKSNGRNFDVLVNCLASDLHDL